MTFSFNPLMSPSYLAAVGVLYLDREQSQEVKYVTEFLGGEHFSAIYLVISVTAQ